MGLFGFARVQLGSTSGRRVHSGSRGCTRACLCVIGGFAWVHLGATGGRRVQLAWVHLCATKCRRVHSGSRGFNQVGLVVVAFIGVCVGLLRLS